MSLYDHVSSRHEWPADCIFQDPAEIHALHAVPGSSHRLWGPTPIWTLRVECQADHQHWLSCSLPVCRWLVMRVLSSLWDFRLLEYFPSTQCAKVGYWPGQPGHGQLELVDCGNLSWEFTYNNSAGSTKESLVINQIQRQQISAFFGPACPGAAEAECRFF